jgi:hypothetical protein
MEVCGPSVDGLRGSFPGETGHDNPCRARQKMTLRRHGGLKIAAVQT